MKKRTATCIRCIVLITVLVGLSLFHLAADQQKAPQAGTAIKLKPDLQIMKFETKRTGILPSGDHQIELVVQVVNKAQFKNCVGPFKILVEWRTNPKRRYQFLGQSGISKICADPGSAKVDVQSRTFNHTVPVEKTYYYRVTIDSMSQVTESDETNNRTTADYHARRMIPRPENMQAQVSVADRIPSCDGIDLIITNVEIIRNSSGNPFIKATIKNLCTGSCTGPIVIEVDESDVLGRPGGVEQQIASGIGSKAEFTMGSALGVAYREGGTFTYVVKVRAEGGCSDRNPGNNTYTITIGPS